MEIAAIVIAIIGLLALSGGMSAHASYTPQQMPQGPPVPWQPTPTYNAGVPMVPSTGANTTGQIFTGVAQIGTKVATQAVQSGQQDNSDGSGGGGGNSTMATLAIAAGAAIITGIVTSLLQAHAARLRGATNENQAADHYVPVVDSFISSIVNAYNSRQATAAQCASGLQQFDQQLYQSMRGLVGAPGTAWNDTNGMAGKCDKTCTVSCCLYFSDLGPALNNISYVLGFPTGKWGSGDPRISGRTVTVPKVFPSKYSNYTRALYSVTLN